MKTKNEHIQFWINQADDDWIAMGVLLKGKKYLQALFFAHLVIEKISKAIWIKYNESNVPPRTHNILHILSSTPLDLSQESSEFLLYLNRFQLEGRYPDYYTNLYQICDEFFTKDIITKTEKIKKCLLEKMQ